MGKRLYTSIADRIRSNVDIDASGCWVWKRRVDGDGYGRINIYDGSKARTFRAMRVSYEAHVGPIQSEMVLDHLCRNRRCVNPDHLEPVTPKVNAQRTLRSDRCVNCGTVKLAKGCVVCRRAAWRKCAQRIRSERRVEIRGDR